MWCGWTRMTRRVVVGPKEALATRRVPVREVNWLGDAPLRQPRPNGMWMVKVRSTRPPRARGDPARCRTTEAEVELIVAPEDGVS
jgi:tRNA-uridine 2-sulfurtransferase